MLVVVVVENLPATHFFNFFPSHSLPALLRGLYSLLIKMLLGSLSYLLLGWESGPGDTGSRRGNGIASFIPLICKIRVFYHRGLY